MRIDGKLDTFLDHLASRSPTPGGGSVAALTGALGVGLVSMVANFTLGKEKYQDVEEDIKEILSSAEDLRQKLTRAISEDISSYNKVSSAYKLPKQTPEHKKKRQEAIQDALKESVSVPVEVCKCTHLAAKLCIPLADKGNINLISDVGVAILLLESAFQSTLLNVNINLAGIKDKDLIVEIREIIEPLEKEISTIKNEVWQKVKAKMTSEG